MTRPFIANRLLTVVAPTPPSPDQVNGFGFACDVIASKVMVAIGVGRGYPSPIFHLLIRSVPESAFPVSVTETMGTSVADLTLSENELPISVVSLGAGATMVWTSTDRGGSPADVITLRVIGGDGSVVSTADLGDATGWPYIGACRNGTHVYSAELVSGTLHLVKRLASTGGLEASADVSSYSVFALVPSGAGIRMYYGLYPTNFYREVDAALSIGSESALSLGDGVGYFDGSLPNDGAVISGDFIACGLDHAESFLLRSNDTSFVSDFCDLGGSAVSGRVDVDSAGNLIGSLTIPGHLFDFVKITSDGVLHFPP